MAGTSRATPLARFPHLWDHSRDSGSVLLADGGASPRGGAGGARGFGSLRHPAGSTVTGSASRLPLESASLQVGSGCGVCLGVIKKRGRGPGCRPTVAGE